MGAERRVPRQCGVVGLWRSNRWVTGSGNMRLRLNPRVRTWGLPVSIAIVEAKVGVGVALLENSAAEKGSLRQMSWA
jgi:hypothetical protein